MKTFEATVLGSLGDVPGRVWVETLDGHRMHVVAGEAVRVQAETLIGRRVRFQAALHESTLSLSSPIFVVGSQYGLQAVRGQPVAQKSEAAE